MELFLTLTFKFEGFFLLLVLSSSSSFLGVFSYAKTEKFLQVKIWRGLYKNLTYWRGPCVSFRYK